MLPSAHTFEIEDFAQTRNGFILKPGFPKEADAKVGDFLFIKQKKSRTNLPSWIAGLESIKIKRQKQAPILLKDSYLPAKLKGETVSLFRPETGHWAGQNNMGKDAENLVSGLRQICSGRLKVVKRRIRQGLHFDTQSILSGRLQVDAVLSMRLWFWDGESNVLDIDLSEIRKFGPLGDTDFFLQTVSDDLVTDFLFSGQTAH